VFVDDLAAPALDDADAHHLARVLRLRAGESVTASDGAGSWRACAYAGGASVDPVDEVRFEPAPSPAVTVGFALTKGDKPEFAVQKLTELGVDRVVPLVAARSVVRWDPSKAERNVERWARVAREAAMQCRRVWLPEVAPVLPFGEAVAFCGGSEAVGLAEPGSPPMGFAKSCVFIGPEGGWSPEELTAVPAKFSIGSTILRAETATLAVGVLLCALRDGFVEIHDE
jgi:16S rRNA (uracil1498-N3)-methyltransferase